MTGEIAQPRPPLGADSISRNTIFSAAAQAATGIFTAALTVFLVRELGPSGYGTFALAVAISATLMIPSDLGMPQSLARFVAERIGDETAIRGVVAMALRLRVLTAAIAAVALVALAEPIADAYGVPDLAWALRGIAIAFFGQSVMQMVTISFVSLRTVSRSFALVISESAVELTASITLVLLGAGATGAAFGRGVGYGFGALLGLVLLARMIGVWPLDRRVSSPVPRGRFLRYAGAMLVVSGTLAIFAQVDVLLIGGLLGSGAAGLFAAPLRLVAVFEYAGQAVAEGVAPRLARGEHAAETAALHRGVRYVVLLQAALLALVVVWAEPIVALTLGSEFGESTEVLRALAPFVFMRGISPIVSMPLNYAGEGRRRIPVAFVALAINVVLDLILIHEIGIVGAAIGTDISFAIYLGAHVWLCQRVLALRLAPLALSLLRAFAAAAAMAAVLFAFGTSDLDALEWIGGLLTGGLTFITVLIATRELSLAELRRLVRRSADALRSG